MNFGEEENEKSEMFMTTKTSEDNLHIGLEKYTLAFGSLVIISNPKI